MKARLLLQSFHSPSHLSRAVQILRSCSNFTKFYAAKHRGRNTVVEHGFVRLVDDAGMALAG